MSAYMLWLSEVREQIKQENPGISVTELSKVAGEKWKKMEDKSVSFAYVVSLRKSRIGMSNAKLIVKLTTEIITERCEDCLMVRLDITESG